MSCTYKCVGPLLLDGPSLVADLGKLPCHVSIKIQYLQNINLLFIYNCPILHTLGGEFNFIYTSLIMLRSVAD